ncbi:MAG: alpha-glucosidase [Anaerolineales bacterium]|nr:alpha-glucosidase [Anaerolineales bacterium]
MSVKIVLIGAGSASFGYNALGDIFASDVLAGSTIMLHDINPDTLKTVEGFASQFVEQEGLPFTIQATTNRKEALQGADFCIISIEIGNRYELWEMDWKIPLQYGIRQVYGENGGPGGMFHALRIIPPILAICADIQAICPEAYVINLSNPMIRISHAVHTKFPDLRFIGLCHEVHSLVRHLPVLLDTPFKELEIKAGGLNHFSILVEASYKASGEDAYPDIRAKGSEYFATAPSYFGNAGERDLFLQILKRFDYLPITTDSHFGEYIHWAADVVDHQGILDFYHNYKHAMLQPEAPPMQRLEEGTRQRGDWHMITIIDGIVGDSGHTELAVNIPNDDLIPYLPANQMVEVPAVIDKHGVHGVKLEHYPQAFAGLLLNQCAVNDMTTDAILSKSKHKVMQALLLDPVVDKVQATEDMLDTILALQSPYLDYLQQAIESM